MGKTKQEETIFISEADQFVFGQGSHYDIYKKLGAHVCKKDGKKGTFFAVWAPNAKSVHVVGNFNGWDTTSHNMERIGDGGIYTLFIPGIESGELYKYYIETQSGGGIGLRIGVEQQDFLAQQGQRCSQVDGCRGLADASFLVCNCYNSSHCITSFSSLYFSISK